MKKILALIMAALLVLSLGVAFADEPTTGEEGETALATTATATLKKKIVNTAGGAPAIIPNETFTFTAEAKTPGAPELTITSVSATENDTSNEYTFTITADTSNTPYGVYEYEISEVTPTTLSQSEQYDNQKIGCKLYVYSTDNPAFSLTTPKSEGSDEKIDEFVNVYDLGTLEVKKTISGNLADPDTEFLIRVTLHAESTVNNTISYTESGIDKTIPTGWTGDKVIEVNLKGGTEAVFTNVPAGVTYTVVEDAAHIANEETTPADMNDPTKGYTVTYTDEGGASIAADDNDVLTVNNDKRTDVDTGITLETLPYVLVLAVALAGAALMIARRRRFNED